MKKTICTICIWHFLIILLFVTCLFSCDSSRDESEDDQDGNDQQDDDDDNDNDDNDDDDDDNTPSPFLNPENFGPYLVGNTTVFLEDESRDLSCGEGNRRLVVEIWYPASNDAEDYPENTVVDFFLDQKQGCIQSFIEHGHFVDGTENYNTGSFRDAPIHPNAPAMPLLVFSHGFTSIRFQNYSMSNYLSSHGYIVVSPDHSCNALVAPFPDGIIHYSLLNTVATLFERQDDISFLIDVFTEDPPEMFAGRIDNEKIAIWGHSFGGWTVSEAIKKEFRAQAVLQLASFGLPFVPPAVQAATMVMYGKEDGIMEPFYGFHEGFFELMPLPKWKLDYFDTGHFAFTDYCVFSEKMKNDGDGCGEGMRLDQSETFMNPSPEKMLEITNPYAVAFFGAILFDYEELYEYLGENHFPEMMEHHFESR